MGQIVVIQLLVRLGQQPQQRRMLPVTLQSRPNAAGKVRVSTRTQKIRQLPIRRLNLIPNT